MVIDFFLDNMCDIDYIVQDENLQPIIALAFLDENNKEHYAFYGKFRPELVKLPQKVTHKDIICIGDFISLYPNYNDIL